MALVPANQRPGEVTYKKRHITRKSVWRQKMMTWRFLTYGPRSRGFWFGALLIHWGFIRILVFHPCPSFVYKQWKSRWTLLKKNNKILEDKSLKGEVDFCFFLFFKLGTYGSLFMPKRSERTFIFHNKVSKDHANTLNTQLIGLGYKFYIDLYIYIISYIFFKGMGLYSEM